MEICIFNQQDRKLAGIVESYEYLRWTRKYSQCGSFTLKAVASDEHLTLFQTGNILWKNDDEETGIIEFIELTGGEQEFIVVSGRFATCFLARRIIWNTEVLSCDLSAAVATLLDHHLIDPADPKRKISGISCTQTALGVPVKTQISYKNLMEAVTDLCDTTDVGIKTVFNPSAGTFAVVLYPGGATQGVFSKEHENVIEQIFTQSISGYANLALVGGEGEGDERIFISVGDKSGEERYEIFVDAKDLRLEDFPGGYNDALTFRAESKLAERAMTQAFNVTVNQYGNLIYKTDFDVGSQVLAASKKWGISMTARITEIEENYDRDGMSLNVTFGKPLLTLAQKLKGGVI